ncbi:hypothetical protein HDU67_006726 [Dinochytrium kinnereticum]|nr:hypothetical protein HDU67_006726 [Dinochytrium kinnereticum]
MTPCFASALALALLPLAAIVSSVSAAARLEPADGKVILSGWIDTEDKPVGNDKPSLFNSRIGRMAGAFQLTQDIPLAPNPYAPDPAQGFEAVQDSDIEYLASQVNNITKSGRSVFVRYAPEMQGDPQAFIASFRKVATAIHAITPNAAMVWSPNLENKDDAESIFTSYYPGGTNDSSHHEYVDWVGLSVYYKGMKGTYPWIRTTVCPANYFAELIDGLGGEGPTYSFYETYCRQKKKPFVLSEGAGTYNIEYKVGNAAFSPSIQDTTRSGVQMSFWNTFLFSETFRAAYPLFKMANMFEFEKEETEVTTTILRDFRTTRDPESLAAFKAQLNVFDAGFEWAQAASLTTTAAVSTATTTTTAGAPATSTTTSVVVTSTTSKPSSGQKVGWGVGGALVAVVLGAFQ